jgi:Fe-S cluster assembly ATP-binding protein
MLEISKLNLEVAGRRILHDLSLRIRPGEMHVLLGANGAGKSSLARVLVGHPQYTPRSGVVWFEGQDLLPLAPEERARRGIFMAFQSPAEVEGVSVANFLRTALRAHADHPLANKSATQLYQHLYGLLDRVGLDRAFTGRSLNQGFSGGESKRLEMLQLFFFQPRFAILDEVDSGLDVDALRSITSALEGFKASRGASFLIITHSIHFVEQICPDAIHVLREGSVVQSGGLDLLRKIHRAGFHEIAG